MVVQVAASTPLDACAVCFGAADSPLLDAARAGVVVMVAITVGVLAAFARWFLRLRRLEQSASGVSALSAVQTGEQP